MTFWKGLGGAVSLRLAAPRTPQAVDLPPLALGGASGSTVSEADQRTLVAAWYGRAVVLVGLDRQGCAYPLGQKLDDDDVPVPQRVTPRDAVAGLDRRRRLGDQAVDPDPARA
jgi:hypothetical protein